MPESEICHFSIAENARRVSGRNLTLLLRMDDFRLAFLVHLGVLRFQISGRCIHLYTVFTLPDA
jgi:hypothetical protein